MEVVRALFNCPIEITSGYRNPEVNADGFDDLSAAKKIRDSQLKFDQLIYEKNRCVDVSFHPRMRQQVLRQPGGPGSPIYKNLEG